MNSVLYFIIKPKKDRYNNIKKIGDKDLIVNTDNFQHQYVSREATVISIPKFFETDIKPGDDIIVHHNVFRRWKDVKGREQNSFNYIKDNLYFLEPDRVFAYRRNNKWKAVKDYCFVKPIYSNNIILENKEEPLVGILKYTDNNLSLKNGDLIGFTPNSEYEFIIDGERLYRVQTKDIAIKYEYKGNEKEYNPSWTESSR